MGNRGRLGALLLLLLAATPVASTPVAAQAPPALLLVLDASGSMNANDGSGTSKIAAAKDALGKLVDVLPVGAPVGLRVYGHRVPNTDKAAGCRDSELVVPVSPLDKAAMRTKIGSFGAKGFTPIGFSLQEAAKDLPPEGERTIVLVSDGVDTCAPPDPCQVAKDLVAQGVALKIEAVGFQVDAAARAQLECIAAATGGSYADAPDAGRLAAELQTLSQRALRTYQTRGSAVTGGETQTRAVTVEPGQYTTTMGAGEERWFGVRLAPGQAARFALTLPAQPSLLKNPKDNTAVINGDLFNPRGEEIGDTAFLDLSDTTDSQSIETSQVGRADSARGRESAGPYALRLVFQDPRGNVFPGARFPVELVVEITGSALSSTTAAPNAGSAASPSSVDRSGGGRIAAGLGGGAAGLVLGVAVAMLVFRRSRPA